MSDTASRSAAFGRALRMWGRRSDLPEETQAEPLRLSADPTREFSPAVDFLRAVAVAAVVMFHAAPKLIPGGFVGVDVFFVISGYLILNQIVARCRRGTFSFAEFWARRALRILPPYLLVVVVTLLVASYVLATSDEFREAAKAARASASLTANIFFSTRQGYFSRASEQQPFLHLWTLSVEEQFYVLAPLIIAGLFAWRFSKARQQASLIVLGVGLFLASLAACVFMSFTEASRSAFFYTSLRAWEFIAGGAVAALIPAVAQRSRFLAMYFFVSGLLLIVATVFLARSTTVYPGWVGLAPVIGACSVILGAEAHRGGFAPRILFASPILGLGLISYSVYLWHWPVLTLTRLANFGEMPGWLTAIAVAASVLLAVLTYVLLERPIREWRQSRSARLGWRPVMTGAAACLILAGASVGYEGWLRGVNAGGLPVPKPEWSHECDLRFDQRAEECLAAAKGYPFGVIMGDSHAWAAFPVFREITEGRGKRLGLLTFPGCAPFLDAARFGDIKPTVCGRYRTAAQGILEKKKLDFAVLDAQWIFHHVRLVPVRDGSILEGERETFQDAVRYNVRALQTAGASRIAIVGPIPVYRQDVPGCVLRADRFGVARERCADTQRRYEERRGGILADLRAVASESDGVVLVDPTSVFCDEEWCRPYDGDSLLFHDYDHLSAAGVARLYSQRKQAFDWVIGEDPEIGAQK